MNQFEPILRNAARYISLNQEETDYFISRLKFRKIDAGHFLLRQGDECPCIYYVLSGALRGFFSDPSGKESTIMFALPDWWITDMAAFTKTTPALLHITAMTASEVLQLERNELENLYRRHPVFERYFRMLMQNAYVREQSRMMENLSLPAIERYNRFLEKYPEAAALIKQKQLASYLGISPEFLSSIKGKKTGGS